MTALHILTFIDLLYEDAHRTAQTLVPSLDHASRVVRRVRMEAKAEGISDVRDAFTLIDEFGLNALQNGSPVRISSQVVLRLYAKPAPDPEWYWTATDPQNYAFHNRVSFGEPFWETCLRVARTIAVLRGLKPGVDDIASRFRVHQAPETVGATP